jgi:hypothetical protein
MGRRGMHIGYWWEGQKEGTTRKTKCMWVDNIKMDLKEDRVRWTGFSWLRIGTSGGLL